MSKVTSATASGFNIELDDTGFFQGMIGTLAGTLEEVVGLEDAASFVGVVGGKIGDDLASQYVSELQGKPPSAEAIGAILVDMKARIGGGFRVESADGEEIVLVNSRCPFAEQVKGRPSLCMMTTNVFGRIVATANGYAHVEIEEAIATGHAGCRVRILLSPGENLNGYEFYP
ncbi:methanogen output domain 1-containing protein [Stappia stellulata]|uniref:methanogen output domain 1-containing protein n=1 Tax=Stappia stellulata TaxID=71235 RepID=UPI00048C7E71|nr:methanogen output domain 1-containing protein [Stappia stellulata]